ncbi:hypothetical protein EIN_489580 [Entamoeba invadens IP1]|uniref:Uncharacterized protein n=1 Tax=Entamoeba invadens IP1 TaxID=370355 RepID=A0A0A1U9W4_ENTIV|nr:hypothetical protein EIN_489580 [Entamoeba invadens IP1]ELP88929.1 hypothetical protein EIN_489580 [Entamoeba invadens IP1]|eukprot:XP_004255700.1 hypothetical protein EIN_489580 [Entamoeba invadens IP1]
METILYDTLSFFKAFKRSLVPPTVTQTYATYYCLPKQFYDDLYCVVENVIKDKTVKESPHFQKNIASLQKLPNPNLIDSIVNEELCITKRSVRPELVPLVDFVLITDESNDFIMALYKVYKNVYLPSPPTIGVFLQNGKPFFEREIPTYNVKVVGASHSSDDYLIKISPYICVSDIINFITYKLHVQGQFVSIQLYAADKKLALDLSTKLLGFNTSDLTLVYSHKRRPKTELFGSCSSVNNPHKHRVISPVLREMWACKLSV